MFTRVLKKLWRLSSPLLCWYFNTNKTVHIGRVVMIGLPEIKGSVAIKSGVLASLSSANPLGIIKPCKLVSNGGSIGIGEGFSASGVTIYSEEKVLIANNVLIGANSYIIDSDMHPLDYNLRIMRTGKSRSSPVEIGNNVWIGANVFILKGVTIGDNSIVGAGCVVARDVPSNSTVVSAKNRIIPHS